MKKTNKLNTKPLDQWPTYAATIKKITLEADGDSVYQGQVLKTFSDAELYFKSHYQDYCTCVTERIRTQRSWSDLELFRDIIVLLGTLGSSWMAEDTG